MESFIDRYEQVVDVKIGQVVIIKDFPCKVSDIKTSKPGKHGSAKARITGYDVLTGKKHDIISTTSSNISIPKIEREILLIMDLKDNQFSVLDSNNQSKTTNICFYEDKDTELFKKIKDLCKNKQITITINRCMDKEKLISYKIEE